MLERRRTVPLACHRGQGIIEYFGAMMIAGSIAVALTAGMQPHGWMHHAYRSLFATSGQILLFPITKTYVEDSKDEVVVIGN